MFSLILDYPDHAQEVDILLRSARERAAAPERVLDYDDVLRFQQVVDQIAVSREMVERIAGVVRATRPCETSLPLVRETVDWGAGPRAGQAILRGAKAVAAMEGRPAVCSDDIRPLFKPVLRHRIGCNYRLKAQGLTVDDLIDRIIEQLC